MCARSSPAHAPLIWWRENVEEYQTEAKDATVLTQHAVVLTQHEDNTAVVSTLTKLTTRSSVMMTELRRLWYPLDTNDLHIRPRYIRSAANIRANILSRELDTKDRQLNPRMFALLQARWGPHTIDRFASMLNTQLLRFNARWRDPQYEDVDCLRLPDATWNTHHGILCRPSPPNYASQARHLLSWPLTGPTRRCTTTYIDSPPQLCISRRRATYSFPTGSASARVSDHLPGASWPFGY
jgi:hypothetical protein